ncbi:endonuclease/exonuclease/phosphatase family protein [Mangrovibacterium diazotrophicum]|uniref:Endonuclease/Exonuclease/phosphatase family protein n=1 Tax=Mangrovibacterium diazotrophicum TaxID=1261403 RepID=A0A419VWY0_9BACT|nr:endonuclease/exonuclease/phosphatase family protein [Mangrovibacterium diazotrophicum]RKD87745.1 Endonuclease/Exonuclease/phosphatase family protein [Mangrovibacterium diazotrophicum]
MKVLTLVLTSVLKKQRTRFFIGFVLLFFFFARMNAQPTSHSELAIMFYNVENLFDVEDDPQKQDDEFCADGLRNWNYFRLKDKLNKISKVILAANGFDPPAVIGLCEVENRAVLESLIEHTPLKNYGYKIIHKDSPDERGIDVAILFRPDKVTPIMYSYHPLATESSDTLSSREILEATFAVGQDTLTVFVNHWPSRYSGQAETEPDRLLAARTLRNHIDAVFEQCTDAKIVVLGDFNDEPDDVSIRKGLMTVVSDNPSNKGELVNLTASWKPKGTLKHQQSWQIFDQVIVSDYLLNTSGLNCSGADARIVDLPFLFEADEHWGGKRLFRTYRGYQYSGGFSDHLPVLIKLSY